MRRPPLKLVLPVVAAVVATIVVAVVLAGGGDDDEPTPDRGEPGQPAEREPAPEGDDGERGERPERQEVERVGDGTVAGPRGRLIVGMGDQNTQLFGDRRFLELGIKRVRFVAPWDAALRNDPGTIAWLRDARAGGFEVLVAFSHAVDEECPDCEAPSAAEFERAFRAFRDKFPWVREYSTWNEPNHASQPLPRRPRLAARYYDAIRENCRGCTVLAADLVADRTAARWIRGFDRDAPLWGVHNYPDTNRFTARNTEAFLRLVDGRVWITETGGIVQFTTRDGRATFPYDERRAARATRQMFRVARSSPRIERLYPYHWSFAPGNRFDAALIGPDGKARPAYDVLREEVAR